MLNPLQREQKPIDEEITKLLIEASPESWNAVVLEVEQSTSPEGVQKYSHVIYSPEGHRDLVEPTDEIFLATRRLALLFRKYGHEWTRAKYVVTLEEDGSWKYAVNFEY